ncbi:spermatogenesis-associated protein 4 [Tachyglossus aculeatus]|uniref:spermatogenesis-associated protein 4 n=1 Tax=Tachyglossus aculeatus TaxID=9261 RepID=UPI0018F637D6|nr:spermatogenesis-associated protein 4 [Tachyglossus aculeatus]
METKDAAGLPSPPSSAPRPPPARPPPPPPGSGGGSGKPPAAGGAGPRRYPRGPRRSPLARPVLRWLQGLQLSFCPRHVHRDFSNGFLIAEILNFYYPEDLRMSGFENGTSLQIKLSNWAQLEKFLARKRLKLSKELIDGTLHCKPGASEILIQDVYTLLTSKRIKTLQEDEADFTDRAYQMTLPPVAQATASKAIKNNIKWTELLTNPSMSVIAQKTNAILSMHMLHRQLDREQNPKRYDMKPTLGELAVRHAPAQSETYIDKDVNVPRKKCAPAPSLPGVKGEVKCTEIKVKQAKRFPNQQFPCFPTGSLEKWPPQGSRGKTWGDFTEDGESFFP